MIFSSRIGLTELAQLCRRLATAIEAGIDIRQVWKREATGRVSAGLRKKLQQVSDAVARGETVSDAIADTGSYFPPLFREMVHVGEETGKLSEVFRQLTANYEHQLQLRRNFLAAIAWPGLQFAAAIAIVGFLIWIMGVIGSVTGSEPIDILGFGLVGNSGLLMYLLFLACVAGVATFVYQAVRRGVLWTRPLQKAVLRVPGVGPCLQTLALARLAWTLHVTLETGMDLRRALPLSLRSTRNARYSEDTDEVVKSVMAGWEVSEALDATGAYPRDFLDTLAVGEQSGQVPESMAILSRQYQDQAQRALGVLTLFAGFAVWAMVAALIILLIFRIFSFYLGTINDALKGF
jgi:type IV pilus assembly protein PilC